MDSLTFYRNYRVVLRGHGLNTLVSPSMLLHHIGERCFKTLMSKIPYMHDDKCRYKFRNGYVVDVYAK